MLFLVACLLVLLPLALLLVEILLYTPWKPAPKRHRSVGNVKAHQIPYPTPHYDAIVVGSGQGGLSVAATLAQFGKKVVVLEQHEVTGGGAHTFSVEGGKARFDAGLHFTIPQHELVLQLACGAAAPPVPTPQLGDASGAYERVALADSDEPPLVIDGGPDELREALARRFPEHAAAIRSYFTLAESVQLRFALWIVSALLPMWARLALLRSPAMRLWRRWSSVTTTEALAELLPGDDAEANKLRALATGLWLDTGSPPSRMTFWMQTAVFGGFQKLGAGYPIGGPQEMALSMVEAIEARGGSVFVRAPVEAILLDGAGGAASGVRLAGGRELHATTVISGLGYRATMALLPECVRPARELVTEQSCGFVMANITLEGTPDELGISAVNTWLQPATEANGFDATGAIDAFMESPLGVPVNLIPLGITFPSCKDASWAERHGDIQACQILCPAEWRHFAPHAPDEPTVSSRHAPPHAPRADADAYSKKKEQWRERLLSALAHHYPKTEGRVKSADISTPLSIENYLRQGKGAAIGLDVTPARFVDPAEVEQLDMKFGKVRGLWLCGQDVLMCGQVLASASGILCALRILGPVSAVRFAVRAARLLLPGVVRVMLGAKHSANKVKSA